MGAKPQPDFKLQTEWIRSYAQTYLPSESGFWFSAEALREEGVTLVDVRHGLRVGTVIEDDKLEEPGALWTVLCRDPDERLMMIVVQVVADEISVTLKSVKRLGQMKEVKNDVA